MKYWIFVLLGSFPSHAQYWTKIDSVVPESGFELPQFSLVSTMDSSKENFLLSGGGATPSDASTAFWNYSYPLNTWAPVSVVGAYSPSVRIGHSASVSADGKSWIIFGGLSGSNYHDDLWKFDFDARSWIQLSTVSTAGPHSRAYHVAEVDPLSGKLVVFSGMFETPNGALSHSDLNDLWKFDFANGEWFPIIQNFDNLWPLHRYSASSVFDPSERSLIVYGGRAESNHPMIYGDCWKFSLSEFSWTEIQVNNTNIVPRSGHTASLAVSTRLMYVFGGEFETGVPTNEVIVLSLADHSWSKLEFGYSSIPAPRSQHTATFDNEKSRLIVYGGRDSNGGGYSDLWWLLLSDGTGPSTSQTPTKSIGTLVSSSEISAESSSTQVAVPDTASSNIPESYTYDEEIIEISVDPTSYVANTKRPQVGGANLSSKSHSLATSLVILFVTLFLIGIAAAAWFYKQRRDRLPLYLSKSSLLISPTKMLLTAISGAETTQMTGVSSTAGTTMFSVTSILALPGHKMLSETQDYVIKGKIAEGGGGAVYDGDLKQESGTIPCVIKVVTIPAENAQEYKNAFIQEVSVMALFVDSQYIIQLYGFTVDPMRIVMKPYANGSLADLLSGKSKMKIEATEWAKKVPLICKEVAIGIVEIHAKGIVHNDIKPANVLLDPTEDNPYHAVICDFGVADVIKESMLRVKALHQSKLLGGSLVYAAPEVIQSLTASMPREKVIAHKADIYAWAIMTYSALFKKHPFAEIPREVDLKVFVKRGGRPSIKKSFHPLSPVIEKAWAQDPILRPEMKEILQMLPE